MRGTRIDRMFPAALAAVLFASALTGFAAPALADGPPTSAWASTWSACADDTSQYCFAEASVTPVGGSPESLTDAGLTVSAVPVDGSGTTLSWTVDGWNTDGVGDEVRNGTVTVVIHTGTFVPRFTAAVASGLRVLRTEDTDGNYTMTVTGRPVLTHWASGSLGDSCAAGTSCGDLNAQADAPTWRFSGTTQDLSDASEGYRTILDGAYYATDAQAHTSLPSMGITPRGLVALYFWSIPVLGNPFLDSTGQPVRGSLNVWLPASYFANAGTDVDTAVTTGFDITNVAVDTGGQGPIDEPATVSKQDGGVALDIPDVSYGLRSITVHNYTGNAPPVGSTVPGAPQAVSATPGSDSDGTDVTWSAPLNDGGSHVSMYAARAFTAQSGGTAAGTCYGDATCHLTGLAPDTTFYVSVSASNALGEGLRSSRVAVTTPVAPTAPTAPRNVRVIGTGALTVTWDAPASDGGTPITGYAVRSANRFGVGTSGCQTQYALRSCTLTGLPDNDPLNIVVTATNRVGSGPASAPVTATAHMLPSKIFLSATEERNALSVTWSTGGTDVTSYTARAYTAVTGGIPAASCTAGPSAHGCRIVGLTAGRRYWVIAAASNAAGKGADSPVIGYTVPYGTPSAPQRASVSSASSTARLAWKTPATDGYSYIFQYHVQVWSASRGGKVVAGYRTQPQSRSWVTGPLVVGHTYWITVSAVNRAGESPLTARLKVVIRR